MIYICDIKVSVFRKTIRIIYKTLITNQENKVDTMEDDNNEGYQESLCSIEISKENNLFVARIESSIGGNREYKSTNFEDVLEQFVMDLQEDFGSY